MPSNSVWLASVPMLLLGHCLCREQEGFLPGSMRPDLVVTSLGDAERDVAIDVTVTSPFSVKRTTVVVVPLTAAKMMEVSKRKK